MTKELTKKEFKKMYMKHRTEGDGWSDEYWDHFYEPLEAKQYLFTEPETTQHNRMFISQSGLSLHLFFMTSTAEERLFDYPGKE